MQTLEPSPHITLNRPRRRRAIAAMLAGVATCLALAAALAYQHNTWSAKLSKTSRELAAAREEAGQLRASLAKTRADLDATRSDAANCAGSLHAVTAKVGAFAKQAAACESIRSKLHSKG